MINKEIYKIAQEGARNHGLLNISVTEFFRDISFKVPTFEEQSKIALFLNELNLKINNLNNKLEYTKEFKKGLLQQMLV